MRKNNFFCRGFFFCGGGNFFDFFVLIKLRKNNFLKFFWGVGIFFKLGYTPNFTALGHLEVPWKFPWGGWVVWGGWETPIIIITLHLVALSSVELRVDQYYYLIAWTDSSFGCIFLLILNIPYKWFSTYHGNKCLSKC